MMPTISPCAISNETSSSARNSLSDPPPRRRLNRSERRCAYCLRAPTRYCLVSPVAWMAMSFMRIAPSYTAVSSNAIRKDRVDLVEGHDAAEEQHDELDGEERKAEQIGRRRVEIGRASCRERV